MISRAQLEKRLASINPVSFSGDLSLRVGLAGLLTPVATGKALDSLDFLYAGRRRNRFTRPNGPQSLYLGEDEEVGSAETKRVAFLGSFAKTRGEESAIFWVNVHLPSAVLDLTDADVLTKLGVTDAEIYDPDWKDRLPRSVPELVGAVAFGSSRFAAIEYWSVRMRQAGMSGICFCVFKTRVRSPCWVKFTSAQLGVSQQWT